MNPTRPPADLDLGIALSGSPVRVTFDDAGAEVPPGVLGVDVAPRRVDGVDHTVVQILFDDDVEGFDPSLLDAPLVADITAGSGEPVVVARDLFDHDQFRRRLRAERDLGRSVLRGILVLDSGSLPPPWVRLAFLPVDLAGTAGGTLRVRRSTAAELRSGVEAAHAAGEIDDAGRATALATIEQRHPPAN